METAGAGDRERWLLETLVGMRGTVALGSRLRGNDEGATRGQRGNDEGVAGTTRRRRRGSRGTTNGSGRPREVAVGDLGWYARDGCAGFPHATAHPRPSRERRGGRGNDEGAWKRRERATARGGCWRPWLVCEGRLRWVPAFEGATRGSRERRGGDEGVAGTTRGRRGGSGGTTRGSRERRGGDEGAAGERRMGVETAGAGDRERWLLKTLVGMRGMVALGSRLRGNDEGVAGTTRGRRGGSGGTTNGSGRPGEVAVGSKPAALRVEQPSEHEGLGGGFGTGAAL